MANDFSGDPNCVALFKFDNNADDSKGGNDLTTVNSPSYDSSDKKEGTHSLDLEHDSQQCCTIADGDLDAGFPGKSGTSEQSFSIRGAIKPESIPASVFYGIVNKYYYTGVNQRTFSVQLQSDGKLRFVIGYNSGANFTDIIFDTALTAAKWYDFLVSYNAADNKMILRIWDYDASALLDSTKEGTAGGDMSPTAAHLEVGRLNQDSTRTFDGKFDELVFFKDVVTDGEHDQMIAGTYGTVTEKESSDTGSGVDAVASLQTPQAKTSSDVGSGIEALIARLLSDDESSSAIEAADVEGEGQPQDLAVIEAGEGCDQLVARIETPTKGGGRKLWT